MMKWPHSVSWSPLQLLLTQQTEFISDLTGLLIAFAAISLLCLGADEKRVVLGAFMETRDTGGGPTAFPSPFRGGFHYEAAFSLQALSNHVCSHLS